MREEPRSEAEPGGQKSAPALTHPDRLYWPDDGVTKEGLADYYAEVWSRMAPFVVERPLALLRCPDGVGGQQFFQKHAWKGLSDAIVLATDPAEPDKPLIAIRDFDGLMGLVQAGALEIHPWGSTLADWERPDTIVMDLDPGEEVSWQSIIEAAKDVRERLVAEGLAAFVKTSGGKGLHVASPLKPEADWAEVKAFTKANRRRHGRRQSEPLRRDDRQGQAEGQDPGRLPAQSTRHDRGRRLFDPRAARRGRFDAHRMG